MILKSTWHALLVFILLSIIGFLLIQNKNVAKEQRMPSPLAVEKAIPSKALANLLEISYSRHDESVLKIYKGKDGLWSFSSKQQKINQARVAEVISNFESLVVLSKMNPVSNAEILGLTPLNQEVVLRNAQGDMARISIGDITPTGSGYYFQVNDDNPVIVGKGGVEMIMSLLKLENLVASP